MKPEHPFGDSIDLVRAFMAREAQDFIQARGDNQWIEARVTKLESVFADALENWKADYLVIESQTNLGMLSRSLTLSPPIGYWDWMRGDLVFSVCPCGRLDHFGTLGSRQRQPRPIHDLTAKR